MRAKTFLQNCKPLLLGKFKCVPCREFCVGSMPRPAKIAILSTKADWMIREAHTLLEQNLPNFPLKVLMEQVTYTQTSGIISYFRRGKNTMTNKSKALTPEGKTVRGIFTFAVFTFMAYTATLTLNMESSP